MRWANAVWICGLLSTILLSGCRSDPTRQPFTFYPQSWYTPIHQAAEYHSADELKKQLEALPQPNARDQRGRTPLMLACGSFAKVTPNLRVLIDAGADVNASDNAGMTPLMYASLGMWRHAHGISRPAEDVLDRMQILIDAGANVNARTKDERTVLMVAASPSSLETLPDATSCRLLVKAGADINARDQNGRTALMHSARAGGSYVSALIELGATIDAQDNDGMTALMHACDRGWNSGYAVPSLLQDRPNLELTDKRGWTALAYAAQYCTTRSPVKELLAAHADLKALNWTPLHAAAIIRDSNQVASELSAGADPNARDRFGRTPLMWASRFINKDPAVQQQLIKAGASVSAQDDQGATALHLAAAGAWLEELQSLLDAGAPIDAKDNSGRTPLMWAAAERSGMFKAQLLIKAGAQVNATDNEGRSALILAVQAAAKTTFGVENVELLVKNHANAELKDSEGKTAHDYAANADAFVRRSLVIALPVQTAP